jgi:uncharacterized protein (DUF2141 family)
MLRALTVWLALSVGVAGVARATEVTVRIDGLDAALGGKVLVQMCKKKDFLVRECTFQKTQTISASTQSLLFPGVPAGDWAVMAYHDQNNNNKLDTSVMGVPVEGTGFSKNAVGNYGPPSFEQALEKVGGAQQQIKFRMTY